MAKTKRDTLSRSRRNTDKWGRVTRAPDRPRSRDSVTRLFADIDRGFHYFWSKRPQVLRALDS